MTGGAPICFPFPEFHVVKAVEGDGISVGHPFDSDGLESLVIDRRTYIWPKIDYIRY